MSEPAQLLIVGGDVRTMDSCARTAEALAVRDGRIVAVGAEAELEPLRGPNTVVVDACGATVLPGLIDAHGHFGHVARSMATAVDCRTPPAMSVADILHRAAERARSVAPGTWILLQGTTFQDEFLRERRFPTPAELAEVSADRPIVYRSSIHHLVVNRCALELAGIERHTVEPPSARIERDAEGEPTGVLAEMFDRFPFPEPTERELADSIEEVAWSHYLANGVTSIQELALSSGTISLDGRDMRGLSPERRARLGMGRTFQTPRLFAGLSVEENIRIVLLARRGQMAVAEGGGYPKTGDSRARVEKGLLRAPARVTPKRDNNNPLRTTSPRRAHDPRGVCTERPRRGGAWRAGGRSRGVAGARAAQALGAGDGARAGATDTAA